MTVTAPKTRPKCSGLLRAGVEHTGGPFCLRYPRDSVPDVAPSITTIPAVPYGTWEVLRRGTDVAVLASGQWCCRARGGSEPGRRRFCTLRSSTAGISSPTMI